MECAHTDSAQRVDLLGDHRQKKRDAGGTHPPDGGGTEGWKTAALLLAGMPAPEAQCKKMVQNTGDMKTTPEHDQRIAKMSFASVYPHYVAKVESKGRTKEELHEVIAWLTGFDAKRLQALIAEKVTFETFFQQATLNPNAHLITGMICGYRIEEIETPLTKQARYLDKLVDELAKGRAMERILRKP